MRSAAAATLAATLALAGCSTAATAPRRAVPPPSVTDVAAPALDACPRTATAAPVTGALPAVTLPCLGGGPAVQLAGVRGPAVITLWASWCLPCQAELPDLQALHAKAGRRLLVLGVVTDDTARDALGLAAKAGVRYPSVVDTDGTVRRRLGYPGPPVTLFVDRSGRVVHRSVGAAPTLAALESLVSRNLGVAL